MTTINTHSTIADIANPRLASGRPGDPDAFAQALQSHAPAAGGITPLGAPAVVNPLLLHDLAAEDGLRRDRDARHRSRELLDALAALRRALLGSGDEKAELKRLSELLSAIPQADDPALAALVRAVAVRATVELCRREHA